jgi:hypothetical protein
VKSDSPFFNSDTSDVERRIVEHYTKGVHDEVLGSVTIDEVIAMRRRRDGVWERKIDPAPVVGVDWATGPSWFVVDKCGPIPDALRDGKVFPFRGRTPMAARESIRRPTATGHFYLDDGDDPEVDRLRRAIRSIPYTRTQSKDVL